MWSVVWPQIDVYVYLVRPPISPFFQCCSSVLNWNFNSRFYWMKCFAWSQCVCIICQCIYQPYVNIKLSFWCFIVSQAGIIFIKLGTFFHSTLNHFIQQIGVFTTKPALNIHVPVLPLTWCIMSWSFFIKRKYPYIVNLID